MSLILRDLENSLIKMSTNIIKNFKIGFKRNFFSLNFSVFLTQIFAIIVLHSRICEMDYEITYGEKRDEAGLITSRGTTLDPLMSGAVTPMSRA